MDFENFEIFDSAKIPAECFLGRGARESAAKGIGAALFWSASGVEFFASEEAWALVECNFSSQEIWAVVRVNGAVVSRFIVPKGESWICLLKGFPAGKKFDLAFSRDTQPMPSDQAQKLVIKKIAVKKGEKILPVPKKMKIEFVGDSITSGEGLAGAVGETDWISSWISALAGFAAQAAEILRAEIRVVSQCGWGVVCGWDNNPACAIPSIYEKICAVMAGGAQEALGAQDDYDFSSWKADAIVINLGTNDAGAFSSAEFVDEKTGARRKMRTGANGAPLAEDGEKLSAGVSSFLEKVRRLNPRAKIIWAYGMIDIPRGVEKFIKKGIAAHNKKFFDDALPLKLRSMKCEKSAEDKGSRGHPGPKTHRMAARKIARAIQKILPSPADCPSAPNF